MPDFAATLLQARSKAGLTQAHLAVAAGLTPSYLSFIENRKKPPPSDDVCRRLAKVLELPEKDLLEVAHMERAPEALRKHVQKLNHSLRKERRSRRRALQSLLSPFLFRGPPGFLEGALDAMGISPVRQKRIREVLVAVGRKNQDREAQITRIVDELPERERSLLLERLPELLGRREAGKSAAGSPTAAGKDTAAANAGLETVLFAPPAPDEMASGPYLLEVSASAAGDLDDLREGDMLLVDPAERAGLGDLVVLRGTETYKVRRVEALGEGFRLGADRDEGAAEHTLDPAELRTTLAAISAGTVVEIRRPLRRRKPRYDDPA